MLTEIAKKYNTDKNPWGHGYIKYYEQYLPNKVDSLLEIGCYKGESLRMWRELYPYADLYSIDLFGQYKEPADIYGLTCIKGNQNDPTVLQNVPQVDIIIDDGSHNSPDQLTSLEHLFEKCKRLYVIEDLHCCREDFYRQGMLFEDTVLGQIKSGKFPYKYSLHEDKIVFIDATEPKRDN